MILAIRKSVFTRGISITLIFSMLITIIPVNGFALTGGPAQPEFNSFTPIGTSDMVDLTSGDFSYNIPIMDVGGFPINLAYSSGIATDQEASWVGLGWDLSIGQINRQMRGIPDDFEGDEMVYENNLKPNKTWGANFTFEPGFFGLNPPGSPALTLAAKYNNYTGFSLSPSLGMTFEIGDALKIGGNISSDENGLCLEPTLSYNSILEKNDEEITNLNRTVGTSFSRREGLSKVNMSAGISTTNIPKMLLGDKSATKVGAVGSSVSYVNNVHTPTIQPGLNTTNFTFKAASGTEIFGAELQGNITGYGVVQKISDNQKQRTVKAYGYNKTHKATKKDLKDFNREKDGSFSVNTTNLPLTNHAYDIFTVKGQGVSGMFRPYRSQIGYVNDPVARNYNIGGSLGLEYDAGNLAHVGVDYTNTTSQGYSGVWNIFNQAKDEFEPEALNTDLDYETVYFKNVGDLSADEDIASVGVHSIKFADYRPIRLGIGITPHARALRKDYEQKSATTNNGYTATSFSKADTYRNHRVKRNQNIVKVRKDEIGQGNNQLLGFTANDYAKPHHTAGYIVTRNDGARYIYGQALYNTKKEEVSFAVDANNNGDIETGLVTYNHGTDNTLSNTNGLDHFYNRISTPAYAHTYLLTLLVSSDYSDLTGDGATDDDFGSYTKFVYKAVPSLYKWRIPYGENVANYNEGLKTNPDDDKGSYLYGEKEITYIDYIETKTHVAKFYTSPRSDAFGVGGESGAIGGVAKEKLDRIELYSKTDFVNGQIVANAVPIKTAHFEYDPTYQYCKNSPNSTGGLKGKLVLKKVYFTYQNSKMGKYFDYEFNYSTVNPDYHLKGYDNWGNYKTAPSNGPTNPEFNYVEQYPLTNYNDKDYEAWTLVGINLPSGGSINIDYESDEYAYVQDQKAMQMFKVCGAGINSTPVGTSNINQDLLYGISGSPDDAKYLYVKLPEEDTGLSLSQFQDQYLNEIKNKQGGLVQFRFLLNTTKVSGQTSYTTGTSRDDTQFDYVSGYFQLNYDECQIFQDGNDMYASIAMHLVDKEKTTGNPEVNPISKAGQQFGRKYLSRFIYGLPDQDESATSADILEDIILLFDNLVEIFKGPNGLLRKKKIARRFIPEKSWIRLSNPNGHKKGGGCRVKSIKMYDNWATMNPSGQGQFYGQEYTYDLGSGMSSGVATYEPIGSKDNPFIQPVFTHVYKVLAPNESHYVERPFGESFFPAPTVTYSRVEVKNLERRTANNVVRTNATGKVVTEFYTSKDYPVLVDQTTINIEDDGGDLLSSLLNITNLKSIFMSQGYVVHLNDMNGKMKSQKVYAEGKSKPISGATYIYSEHQAGSGAPSYHSSFANNIGRLNNSVYTLDKNGTLGINTIGVEVDITNDFREKRTSTQIVGLNGNVGTVLVSVAPVVVPAPIPSFALHRDKLRMASTTKVIHTFGLLKETIAYDAGARVSTKNLVWDHQTGEVLVTETTNEYDDNYYSFSFPAFWHYDGMGAASRNTEVELLVTHNGNGIYQNTISGQDIQNFLTSGDEVLIYNVSTPNQKQYGWIETAANTNEVKVIDRDGLPILNMNKLKVIRSGRRNLLNTAMASIVMMDDPITLITGDPNYKTASTPPSGNIQNGFLEYDLDDVASPNHKVINAGAIEFSEDWELQCDCDIPASEDILNDFVFNRKGVWRALQSYVYLTGRKHTRKDATANTVPDPRQDGFYVKFAPFYALDASGNWLPPQSNLLEWTSTSMVTQYSPYGFELENRDALNRYSAAQYGYNFKFPMAVGANTKYSQMGFDGFEDYDFNGCTKNQHFGFKGLQPAINRSSTKSHTGRYSIMLAPNTQVRKFYRLEQGACVIN